MQQIRSDSNLVYISQNENLKLKKLSKTYNQFPNNGLPKFTNNQLVRKLIVSEKLSPIEDKDRNLETQTQKFKISQILTPSIIEGSSIKRGSTLDSLGFTTDKNWAPLKTKMRRTGSLIRFQKSSETAPPPLGYYDLKKAEEKVYPKVRMLVSMKKPSFRSISNLIHDNVQDRKNQIIDKFLPENMEGFQLRKKISELQQISHYRYDVKLKAENEILKQKQRLMPQPQDFDDTYFQQLPQNIDQLKKRLKNLKRELNKIGKQKKKKDQYD